MKFNCGLTRQERRLAKYDRLVDRLRAKKERALRWHRWFAWHPVRVADGDCRWLEYVQRRFTDVEFHGVGPFERSQFARSLTYAWLMEPDLSLRSPVYSEADSTPRSSDGEK